MTRCVRGTYGVRYLSTGYSVTSVDMMSQVSVLRHIFGRMRLPLQKIFEIWIDMLIYGSWVHYRYIKHTTTLQ
jgi:hypothetical protein